MRPSCTTRRATSLLEVLVVVAIVGTLTALLLSAVQQVRAAAARANCANNLRQQGQALHQYHGVHHVLPMGVAHPEPLPGVPPVGPGPPYDPYPLLNWQARLLPYLEQDALWAQTERAYVLDRHHLHNPPHVAAGVPVPVYICPADGRRYAPGTAPGTRDAPTGYVGVNGTNQFEEDGVLFLDSKVRLTDITDGTSNTLLVGERPPERTFRFGRWYGGWGPWGTPNNILGVREPVISGNHPLCLPGLNVYGPSSLDNPCSPLHFWSFHPAGANFLFGDGAVRFIPYASASLLPALATRAAGDVSTIN